MSKLYGVILAVMVLLGANTAVAGSVWVNNYLDTKIEVCRGGGYAGCWVVQPCRLKGPDYVQTDRPFWLNRPVKSRTFSVTAENEQYEVTRDYEGKIEMKFCPNGCPAFDRANCE